MFPADVAKLQEKEFDFVAMVSCLLLINGANI
jgi:hypothetical protein